MKTQKLIRNERGQTMIEFVMILFLTTIITICLIVVTHTFLHSNPPSLDQVKVAVEQKGFMNVVVGENNPILTKEICKDGQSYFPVTAKTTLGTDVNLYACLDFWRVGSINFR